MFQTIVFLFSLATSNVNATAPKTSCEWIGPRIDGISVEICDGSVRAYRDQAGNVLVPSEVK